MSLSLKVTYFLHKGEFLMSFIPQATAKKRSNCQEKEEEMKGEQGREARGRRGGGRAEVLR